MSRFPFDPDDAPLEVIDDYGDDEYKEVRCKYCRARDLHWEEARGKRNEKRFVLMEANGSIHCCHNITPRARVASADEFEAEDEPKAKDEFALEMDENDFDLVDVHGRKWCPACHNAVRANGECNCPPF